MGAMKNEVVVAIAKGIKSAVVSEASNGLSAGKYAIDQTVRIQGTITKGEDYDSIVHMAIPTWDILAVALSKLNGITIESIVKEALAMGENKEMISDVKAKAQSAIDAIKGTAVETCAGRVTTKVTFSVVGAVQEKVREEIEVGEMASDLLP